MRFSLVKLQPGEGRRVALMMLYSAAATGGVLTIGLAAASALFLSRLPATSTPYLFILPGFLIVPVLFLYNRFASRRSLVQAVLISDFALLAIFIVLRLLLSSALGQSFALLAALNLWVEISYTLALLQFWTFATQIFHAREAKRLFGLIAVGGSLSNIAAGAFVGPLGKAIGVANLLWIVVGALLVCALCVWALRDAAGGQRVSGHARATPREHASAADLLRGIRRSPLLLSIAGLTVLVALLINTGAYQFFLALQPAFAGRDAELVAYLGRFELLAGIGALLVQVFLTARVMSRSGVFVALLFFPLGMAGAAGAALLSGGALWSMALTRAMDPVFRRAINTVALKVLYLPVPAGLRQRAQELIESLYAFSFGLLGVAFLLVRRAPSWKTVHWSVPILVMVGAWLAVLRRARKPYVRTLAENIQKRRLDLSAEPLDVTDPTAVRILTHSLQHPDPLHVMHTLQLIAGAPGVHWDAHVAPLLDHPAPEVRILALQHLGRPANYPYAEAIAPLCHDPDEQVSAAAIQACAAVRGEDALPYLSPFLESPRPHTRGAAVLGLMRFGGASGQQAGLPRLEGMLASDDPALRVEAARVLEWCQPPGLAESLVRLLDDPSPEVQVGALRAMGEARLPELIRRVIDKLGMRATAAAAAEALVRYGTSAEPALAEALHDKANSRRVRRALPKVLQGTAGRRAWEALCAHLEEPDEELRLAVHQALARLASGASFPLPSDRFYRALDSELRALLALQALRADLGSEADEPLLRDALDVRLRRGLERVFFLLAALHPRQPMASIHRRLESGEAAQRAEAIELLDNLLPSGLKAMLLPLLEAPLGQLAQLAHSQLGVARRSAEERLAELASGSDPWPRACALYRIGVRGLTPLEGIVREALQADDDLVRETAIGACRELLAQGSFRAVLQEQALAIDFAHSSAYARRMLETEVVT